jgi:hypothetical protein
MKHIIVYGTVIFLCLGFSFFLHPEEGMIPLSEIHKLDLEALGFQMDSKALYNPNGTSIIDGIINLKGCTASFVSEDGLFLTNYHCAFRAIQSVTTTEKDFLQHGFIAKDRSQEVPAQNYTVRVIEFYRDVSREVLSAVKKKMSYAQRTTAIEKKIKKIEVKTEKKYPDHRAEVAEMFMGKTYVLFVYKYVKDIRLVYAPPRSIGEYGGEADNWMWPRHTGDFAFLRAYTAPDGSFTDYSPDNIPYHPKKYIPIAPEGVKEEDFVFILGYPGRTYRHRTSYYLSFEENIRKPFVVALYSYMIDILEEMGKRDRTVEIKLAARLKSISNVMKRSKGQLKGMKNLKLVKRRQKKEAALQQFIDASPELQEKYGNLLERLRNHFEEKIKNAQYDLVLESFLSSSTLLNNAYIIYEASIERQKKNTEREYKYMDRNFNLTQQRMKLNLKNYYEPVDKIFLKDMFLRAIKLKENGYSSIPAVEEIIKDANDVNKVIDNFIETAYTSSKLNDESYMISLFNKTTIELQQLKDPFMQLAHSLYPIYQEMKNKEKRQKGQLDMLLSQLINVKQKYEGKDFIPDANSTLRLTYGRIRGYSPADAVFNRPFTTLAGVVEKHTGQKPFIAPQKLIDLYRAKDFGRYIQPGIKSIPVCMLYNMDTTGGNSGSPVLNAKGQLVGLNFDRVFEATINDYAWDESYSRSIGVDIRYILWFLDKFGDTRYLLKEMKVR